MICPQMLPWLYVGLAGINNCIGNILLKHSRKVAEPGMAGLLFCPWFMAGLFFYTFAVVLFAKALDVLPVSRAYPVLAGLGFALLAVVAALVFGESLALRHIFGMLFVFVGIVLLAQ